MAKAKPKSKKITKPIAKKSVKATKTTKKHSKINKNLGHIRYMDMKLYQEIIFLDAWFDGKYCIENVIPYYQPLIPAQQNNRHLFWCNFKISTTDNKEVEGQVPGQDSARKRQTARQSGMD